MTNKELKLIAARGRCLGMQMVFRAASGHIGGSLSAMDILTELYFEQLRVDPERPQAPERDRFVMSKGHCTPALYSILALRGYFPEKQLELFRSIEGHMSGHPDMVHVPGVDMSTGSLGQGLSAAVGMAHRRQDGLRRLPRLRPDGRRRDRGGPDLGGRYVRRQVQAGQPLRHS